MVIRNIDLKHDTPKLREIHARYFADEFKFEELLNDALATFIIESDSGEIITAGSIRPLIEAIAITNKDMSVRNRKSALIKLFQILAYNTNKLNQRHLHAFIQDDTFYQHLLNRGFRVPKGKPIIIEV